MNSGGHAGIGILFYITTAQLLHQPITVTGVLLAIFFALLPDADIPLSYLFKIRHRKYTHTPIGATILTLAVAPFSIPFATATLSHYLADYVYSPLIKKLLKVAPGNTVSDEEFYSAAIIGFTTLYSYVLIVLQNDWFTVSTAIAITVLTLVEVYDLLKK